MRLGTAVGCPVLRNRFHHTGEPSCRYCHSLETNIGNSSPDRTDPIRPEQCPGGSVTTATRSSECESVINCLQGTGRRVGIRNACSSSRRNCYCSGSGTRTVFPTCRCIAERRRRNAHLEQTKSKWQAMQSMWRREAADGTFNESLTELRRAKEQRERLDSEYANEKQKLLSSVRERQLQQFLGSYFLDDHRIPNIGSGRKATLASFGIETAADITRQRILSIRGFGPSLTADLVNWMQGIEGNFVFDASKGVNPQDAAALDHRFTRKRQELESILLPGPERLERIRTESVRNGDRLKAEVEKAAHEMAQAMADLERSLIY